MDPDLYLYPIVAQWYERIGTKVKYLEMPMKRSLVEANRGRVDAELSGGLTVAKTHKNLRKVPTSLTTVDLSMFSLKKMDISPKDVLNYRVAAPIGYEFLDYSISGFKEKVNFVSKPIQLAGMLAEGRVDIVVSENSTMLKLLLEYKKLPKVKPLNKVYILPKPISQVELYHWVHKSNESMIPLLDQELVKMKKDRVIERAKERYTNRLLELVNQ